MSSHLDSLIASARELDASLDSTWTADRATRIREGALRRRDVRVRRDRALRRGLFVAGGAGLLVLALLRVASSAPPDALGSHEQASTSPSPPSAPTAEVIAARTLGDAGYARD